MGTGWRRAFCTSIPRERDAIFADTQQQQQQNSRSPSPSPRSCAKLGFLSGGSNPATPRIQLQSPSLRCRTTAAAAKPAPPSNESSTPQCKSTTKSPRTMLGSNPSSPRSPLKFSIFKKGLRLSRNGCGVCLRSVKTGQGTAIYTAECGHSFHFPCIVAHVRKLACLVCPVCSATWSDVPLLAIHKSRLPENSTQDGSVNKSTHGKARGENGKIEQRSNAKAKPSESRTYDDDEPLLSPRFNPIPEANENGEDDNDNENEIAEFRGFFADPNFSASFKSLKEGEINSGVSRRTEVSLLFPETAVISVTRNFATYALALRVKAPPPLQPAHNRTNGSLLDPLHRAPIDLVTVLDLSGSMSGAKLQMLKRAVRLIISSLGSADRLSIVGFSSTSKRLLPLRRMTAEGQRSARHIVDRLSCSRGTSVGDALTKATKVLDDRRHRNPVGSIMLLSDGQDEKSGARTNNSDLRLGSSHVSSTRFAHIEIPIHTFGFGENGTGYGGEPDNAFAKCVGGLLSVVAQDLRIQLGSSEAEISAVYSYNGRPTFLGSCSARLGDLYAEEERELLVELRVPTSASGVHHVISIHRRYKDPATQELILLKEQTVVLPRLHTARSAVEKVERLRNLFITTRAIAESRRLIEQNELSSADQLLASALAVLMQSSSISVDEYVRGLEAELAGLQWRREQLEQEQLQQQRIIIQRRRTNEREVVYLDESGEPLTPTSAWRAAEQLAKVAIMRKSMNRLRDLHGFENARF